MGSNHCCGCNENPNIQKEIWMKPKPKPKPKQRNITQENKPKAHEPNNNEHKISKLGLSEINTEFHECKSGKDKNSANKISMKQVNIKKEIKQTNLAHQNTINTSITNAKVHAPNHDEAKHMSDEPAKIDVHHRTFIYYGQTLSENVFYDI
eukprot:372263_1